MTRTDLSDSRGTVLAPPDGLEPGLLGLKIEGWVGVRRSRSDSDPRIKRIDRNGKPNVAIRREGKHLANPGGPIHFVIAPAGADQLTAEPGVTVRFDGKIEYSRFRII